MTSDEKALIEIAQMICDQDIAEVAKRVKDAQNYSNRIEELRSVSMLNPLEVAPQMHVMGQTWGDWRRKEIASLNLNLAMATLHEEAAKNKARRSLGRCIALAEIFGIDD